MNSAKHANMEAMIILPFTDRMNPTICIHISRLVQISNAKSWLVFYSSQGNMQQLA